MFTRRSSFAGGLLITTVLSLAALSLGAAPASAQVKALDFTGGGNSNVWLIDVTLGWDFNVTSPVTVSAVGVWDEGFAGLATAHDVGIWDSNGTNLIPGTTVTQANSNAVASTSGAGDWRFTPLGSPLTLPNGHYVIGAHYVSTDANSERTLTTSSMAPGMTYVGADTMGGATLTEPTFSGGLADGVFGPNMLVTTTASTAAPEPASLALLGLALPIIGTIRRRKANVA